MNGRTLKAVKEIIRICRDRNLLKEYLSERETEVEEIMFTLFDQEHVWNIERNNIRAAALAEGRSEGINQGILQKETQVVLSMFRHNMSVEDIAEINDLSIDKVKEILKTAAVLH